MIPALVVLAALLVAAPSARAVTPLVPADHRARSIMQDDASLLKRGPAVRDEALDTMRDLGVDTVRVQVLWRDLAPAHDETARPAAFDAAEPAAYPPGTWAPLQDLDAAARARGLTLLATLTGPGPVWGSGCRGPLRLRPACRPDPEAFGAFVTAAGRALPAVRHWTVWNEPNLGNWLSPQYVLTGGRLRPVAPALYRDLAFAAADGLAASGHRGDELLLGETAPGSATGLGPAMGPMAPVGFTQALLCEDRGGRRLRGGGCAHPRRLPATGWAHHPYARGGSASPTVAPRSDEVLVPSLGRLTAVLDRAARRGLLRPELPIDLTEVGVQTDPPDPLSGVPPGTQARYDDELAWLAWRTPRVRSVAQYLLDDERFPGSFQSGLRFAGGRPKPSLAAYRLPVWLTRTRLWARVRPAWRLGRQKVALEQRVGGRWLVRRPERTDAVGVLDVPRPPGAGPWRMAWRDPSSGRVVHSRVAG